MDLSQITLLYRVRKTILQMLKDRGYTISEKKLAQTKQEFENGYNGTRGSLNMLVFKKGVADAENDPSSKLLVFFPDEEKFNTDALNQITLIMLENSVYNAIIVIKGSTSISKRVSRKIKFSLLIINALFAYFCCWN